MRPWPIVLFLFSAALLSAAHRQTETVVFVMTDGLRWQEVFQGADPALMNKTDGGVDNPEALQTTYGGVDAEHRRSALMPFVWQVIASDGQIFGDPGRNSPMVVTNGLNFSYPGYSEALTGFPDSRIHSNDKVPNPNATVFEWLNARQPFHRRVAAFGAWDVFPFIFNAARSGLLVDAGWDPLPALPSSPKVALLNQLKQDGPRFWKDEPFDVLPFYTALEYLKTKHPRLLFIGLGETDDWAHSKRYDLYLDAAHRADQYLRTLWTAIQADSHLRQKTALIFATDHGRGPSAQNWTTHGEKVPEAKQVWLMILGPDTKARGVRENIPITQSQIAPTIAALLGQDYSSAVPQSGKPVLDVLPQQ